MCLCLELLYDLFNAALIQLRGVRLSLGLAIVLYEAIHLGEPYHVRIIIGIVSLVVGFL
jgi:hypothetical protein